MLDTWCYSPFWQSCCSKEFQDFLLNSSEKILPLHKKVKNSKVYQKTSNKIHTINVNYKHNK